MSREGRAVDARDQGTEGIVRGQPVEAREIVLPEMLRNVHRMAMALLN
jgi:hypothetical protein